MNERKNKPAIQRWGSVLLVVGALAAGWWLYRTGPVATPEEEKRPPKIVKTATVRPATYRIDVTANGSVVPARRVRIEPQVSGHVVRHHADLIPGAFLKQGAELYAIDSKLIELELQENQAEIDHGQAKLNEDRRKLDEGKRLAADELIAATELASLEATVRMQEAELVRLQARHARNQELLERHIVRAPFNALVLDETVEIGQRVDPGQANVTLVGTDEFWVQTSLPTDQLEHVRLPSDKQPGAKATVLLDTGNGHSVRYSGEVIQRLGDLTEEGRMARILVRVKDPLGIEQGAREMPLLLGSYVEVAIDAGELKNVLAVDRAALREGHRVWVVNAKNRLEIREVTVRWRKGETVYVDNVMKPGEALIVSNLRVALPDMEVQPQPIEEPAVGSLGASGAQP